MLWPILALLTAFFSSLTDIFSKYGLKRDNVDEYVAAWSLRFFALLLTLPILLFVKIPNLGDHFWIALFIGGSLNTLNVVLYMKALKNSDLSLTIPMITFTPLFLLITSPIIVHEFPSFYGLIGIFLIVFGSYVLNIKERHKGFLAPFKALVKENGPRLMLIVAFVWSITSNIDKIGIENSSPVFWVVANGILWSILLFPIVLSKSRKYIRHIPSNLGILVPIGALSGLTTVIQMITLNLTLVAYVISIKRAGVIFGVLAGYFIFKEKNIKERLLGVIIMIVGVIFITLS